VVACSCKAYDPRFFVIIYLIVAQRAGASGMVGIFSTHLYEMSYCKNANNPSGMKKLDIDKLRAILDTTVFGVGDRLLYLPIVDSTNILAMDMALQGAKEGVVVLTDSQLAGKGRQGRRWIDMAGYSALSSTILQPLFPSHLLVMIAALAVVATIADTCGIVATIKWPNDILIGGRKVAGILIETSHDHLGHLVAAMGIGVNVNGHITQFIEATSEPQSVFSSVATTVTTLAEECKSEVSREAFLACLLRHLESQYLALQQEAQTLPMAPRLISRLIREQWRNQLSTLGRATQVRQGSTVLSGVAEDVNENGELLLRCHSGERINVSWGDVE
jgi:BirA family biotin operon repressor/biotin-[acetyl-CoA-carboxylase] ligase